MMGRALGLDVGDKRIGIALSDETRLIASPYSVYTRIGYTPDVRHICALCEKEKATLVVCGLPRNMDGSAGFQAQKVLDFAKQLTNAGLSVVFEDERLTTVSAHDALIEGGMRREKRKETVDKVAAALILQQYLDAVKIKTSEEGIMADNIKDNVPEENEESSIIELTDEDGVVSQFEYLTTIDHEGELYVVLMLIDEEAGEDDDDGEVLILQIEKDPESGEDIYVSIEDDEISQAVFDKFVAMMDEDEGE